MNEPEKVAKRLEYLLFKHQMSQADLADLLGITRQAANNLVNGVYGLKMTHLQTLGYRFGRIEIDWLLFGDCLQGIAEEGNPQLKRLEEKLDRLLTVFQNV